MEGISTLQNVPGLDYDFQGPISAQFVSETGELADGEWSAEEPPTLSGDPAGGGMGTWGATFVSEVAPDAGVGPCANIATDGAADASVDAGP